MPPPLPEQIMMRKIKKAQKKRLKLLKVNGTEEMNKHCTEIQKDHDETEQLISKHLGEESEYEELAELRKKKKKKKLELVEEALDGGANEDLQPKKKVKTDQTIKSVSGSDNKKKKKKKNTDASVVQKEDKEPITNELEPTDVEADDCEESVSIKANGEDSEETGYESEETQNAASTLGYDASTNWSFESLQESVSEETMKAIEEMGFKDMTEIQAKAIPKLLEGRDLRGTAKTGAGKTLAFVIPAIELISKLKFKPRNGTGVIIVSPTRELSMQTFGVVREVMQHHSQTYGLIMGGANRKGEAEKLNKGVNILVATPGRLLDHLQNTPHFVYKNLVCLVIDEADRIFDVGFEEEMKQILRLLPKRRQTMLFSATKDQRTNNLANLALKSQPVEVDVAADKNLATAEGLEQAYLVVPSDKRFLVLYTFIKKNKKKKVMVFFSSCMEVKFYSELLNYIDLPVMCIHGKQKQVKRTNTFYQFCNADTGVLLCTDVAARGWDIPAVDWIVQYDPPDDPKEYIHRVGRTARAGGQGNALLFLRDEEIGFIRYLKAHRVKVDPMDITWSKVANIQPQLEKLISQNYFLHASAKEAFKGYVRAYNSHQEKEVFNVNTLNLKQVAKCFGFPVPPFVDLGVSAGKRPQKRGGGGGYGNNHNKKLIKKTKIFRKVGK
ncbi:putative ATP-dependent RNA helicase pitchoune isoform X2 [Oratosquilla oratoria]|uniref:putative ATP-dependent RNA helicase pitchoune isoform X2 n=1 Tax=Oratosquilla oratoria TaxID=337810 RepID=UPI003F774A82